MLLRLVTIQVYTYTAFLPSLALEVLTRAVRPEKFLKGIQLFANNVILYIENPKGRGRS